MTGGPVVTLDKLSVTGFMPGEAVGELVVDLTNEEWPCSFVGRHRINQQTWGYSWKLADGVFVTVESDNRYIEFRRDDGAGTRLERHVRFRPAGVRMEWNPNRTGPMGRHFVAHVMNHITDWHFTRCDVAADYDGLCIGDYTLSRPRVLTERVDGRDGLQTMYLGRLASRRCIVGYDKALELKLSDRDVMRVESRARYRPGEAAVQEDLFAGLSVTRAAIPVDTDVRTAGMLALYHYAPDVLRRADPKTRKRVRQIAQDLGEQVPVEDAYKGERERLLSEVSDICTGSGWSTIAPVYEV